MPLKPTQPFSTPLHALSRPKLDHRDRDFLKSFRLAGTRAPSFPEEYVTDALLWMPNQSEVNPEFPDTAPQPFGCTNYTQSDLAADLDGKLYDPQVMENETGANARGGFDVRQSLLIAKRIGLIAGFYNIKAYAPLDYFDAIRLACFSGLPEKRSASLATPWYHEWSAAASGAYQLSNGEWRLEAGAKKTGIMPMPKSLNWDGLGWHNWKIGGWKNINGSPYLMGKPWMGKDIGDAGWLYFDRATINAVMTLRYTIAFTATDVRPEKIYTIDMAKFDYLMSYLKTLVGFRY